MTPKVNAIKRNIRFQEKKRLEAKGDYREIDRIDRKLKRLNKELEVEVKND